MKKRLLFICLALLPLMASAYDACVDGIYYDLKNDAGTQREAFVTYKNTNYNSYSGDIVIPYSIIWDHADYIVTSISSDAFRDCYGLTSVTIPYRVTSIGELSFFSCRALTSIVIPSSVTDIYYNSFAGCFYMEQMIVDSSNTVYDSRNGCNAIIETATEKLVAGCQNTQIPYGIKTIGRRAFEGRWYMQEMAIPETVTTIEEGAFEWCFALNYITLPTSVSFIGKDAFYKCDSLTSVRCNMKTPPAITMNVFTNRAKATLLVPKGSKDAYEAADYWKEFNTVKEFTPSSSITFADPKVKAICVAHWDTNGDGELSRAEAAAVSDISSVFNENKEITLFDELQYFIGLTSIEDSAFLGCSGLTSITIPNSVTSIGDWSFTHCSALLSIIIPANVTNIGFGVFAGCNSMISMTVDAGNNAFDSRNGCNAIIQTSTNTLIAGCQNMTIPEGVTTIKDWAMNGIGTLTSVVFPNSLNSIGVGAFSYCWSLTSITIPANVTSIGDKAFEGAALTTVKVENSVPVPIKENTFPSPANATLYVPAGSKAVYESADYWKDFKNIKEF